MLNQSKEVLCIYVSFWESRDTKKEPETNFYDMLCDIEEVFTVVLRRTLRSETVLATEGHLKMMKNTFYFISKASPFVFKIFKLLSWLFGHVTKLLGKKDQVNFKFYDVTTWLKNNRNTHIAKYFEKSRQADQETRLINRM